jgi:hypothetical protein
MLTVDPATRSTCPTGGAHERDLLGHYLKVLATFGVSAPGLDEAWSDYRRATVHDTYAALGM